AFWRLDEKVARGAVFMSRAEAPAAGAGGLKRAEVLWRNGAGHCRESGLDLARKGRAQSRRKRELEMRLGRQAHFLAHGKIGVELERRRLRGIARLDPQRKNNAAVVAERLAAVGLFDTLWRRKL